MKIAVAGTGYVGLSISTLLSQSHEVKALDIIPEKVDRINRRISPIKDEMIEKFFAEKDLNLTATMDERVAYADADYVVISTPTNYDPDRQYFDTAAVEAVIEAVLRIRPSAWMVIKSTIPIGYTAAMRAKYHTNRLFFSPEFLREGKALLDNLQPSRIIMGCNVKNAEERAAAAEFMGLLRDASEKPQVETLLMGMEEAEAVKLFANTFLAMRVSYFNELDTFAESRGLDADAIIRGVCADPRIGSHYNNPSFGYGGYCLPKDTKQLLANYEAIPQTMIRAVIESNDSRKQFIANQILKRADADKPIGIYRLTMKAGSDNFRESSIVSIMRLLRQRGAKLMIYEPTLPAGSDYLGIPVTGDADAFKSACGLIVANRYGKELADVREKLYTRDLFNRD